MTWLNVYRIRVLVGTVTALFALNTVVIQAQDGRPVAHAGLSRYSAQDPVVLDGTGSYDPDSSGSLSYSWRQISGPSVVITDASTAKPMISGFVQTTLIQECEFELMVSDGEYDSFPDTVKVIVVPTLTECTMVLENKSFDPQKPTIIFFDGVGSGWHEPTSGGGHWRNKANAVASNFSAWEHRANIISFYPYVADDAGSDRDTATYYRCADMIIVYLSAVAPDYDEYIQTMGYSLGGLPAIDVARFLNETYKDRRYAINRVTLFDTTVYLEYSHRIRDGLIEHIDGEQCWIENYVCTKGWGFTPFYDNILNVAFDNFDVTPYESGKHGNAVKWYGNSITDTNMSLFNNGVMAGAYWSVIGPGKNLQLAPTMGAQTYKFKWYGDESSGYMGFYDESNHPGRLPEPVTLVGPVDVGDPNGGVLTCEESENAVGYQLLLGSDFYRVMDYTIISDTSMPPSEVITTLPFDETWWTIRVYDEYGSTIYADPKPIGIVNLSFLIENISTGKRYGYIQDAIDDAMNGDEIILSEGSYRENINLRGKNLTIRSINPTEPAVVAATVISGSSQGPTVILPDGEHASCLLDGFTITGGTVGISCRGASPTIRNCTIGSTGAIAIEFWYDYEPIIIDCTILGLVKEQKDPRLVAYWRLDEEEGNIAYDSAGENHSLLFGDPEWRPTEGKRDGALEFDGIDDYVRTDWILNPASGAFSVFTWIKGGAPGQTVVSQPHGVDWLRTDILEGNLVTELKGPGRSDRPLLSQTIITDGEWHRIGFIWDGENRALYVDDILVAEDTQANLQGANGGLYIGCGRDSEPSTFWSGLIDDVRIYNRAVSP